MTMRDLKHNFLIETALSLFLSNNVEDVTMKDVADAAGVGEMTIYRHFGKKHILLKEVILKLQNDVFEQYFNVSHADTGYEKLKLFYRSFLSVFKNQSNYFRFLREFDLYMINQDNTLLADYENELNRFKDIYLNAYHQGLEDKSVRQVNDPELFYYSSTHALIELCKKLSFTRGVLPQDERISKESEINCLIDSFLMVVKNS